MTEGFHKRTLPLRNFAIFNLHYKPTDTRIKSIYGVYILQIKQLFTVVPLTSRHHQVLQGIFSRAVARSY